VFYIMGLSDVVEFVLGAGAEICIHVAIMEDFYVIKGAAGVPYDVLSYQELKQRGL